MDKVIEFYIMKEDKRIAFFVCNICDDSVETYIEPDLNFIDVSFVPKIRNIEELNDWFETRIAPRSRFDIRLLLEELDISIYHPYYLVKKSQGAMFEDNYWIKFLGEQLTWNDVNPRIRKW